MGLKDYKEPEIRRVGLDKYYDDLQRSIDFWDRYYDKCREKYDYHPNKRKVKITRTYTETVEFEE